jgi:hypothetical protein
MEVDAFVADSIVASEGKLYVQGAGWNIIHVANFPVRHARLGIGVLIHVPYTATNQMHKLDVRVEDSDGALVSLGEGPPNEDNPDGKIYRLGGEFNVGRPPLLPAGDDQVVPLAINVDGLIFHKPDMYRVVVAVDGTDMRSLPIRVQQLSQPGPLPR